MQKKDVLCYEVQVCDATTVRLCSVVSYKKLLIKKRAVNHHFVN
jgi:hypothetical protein